MADFKEFMKGLKDDQKLMDALDRALMKSKTNYEKTILDQLDQIFTDMIIVDGLVQPNMVNRQVLDQLDWRVFDVLENEGLERFIKDFNEVMTRRFDTLDRLVKRGGIDGAAGIDFQNLDIMESKIVDTVRNIGVTSEYTAGEIRDKILEYKLDMDGGTSNKFSEIRDTLIKKANILPRYAGTVTNTTLFSATRVARFQQAKKAGIGDMKYVGVLDDLTRPFCREHVGVVRSIEYWEQLQNNVSPNPVSEYAGGYQCRHFLIMWLDEFE